MGLGFKTHNAMPHDPNAATICKYVRVRNSLSAFIFGIVLLLIYSRYNSFIELVLTSRDLLALA